MSVSNTLSFVVVDSINRPEPEFVNVERDSATSFFASDFFHESVSPKPLIIPLGPVRFFFSKICGDIRSSKFATGVVDTGGKWKKSFYDFFWTPLGSRFSI
jgi:hypothetical protein